jgi:hypothetical protein
MNHVVVLMLTLLAAVGMGCSANRAYVPSDAAQIHYSSVSISVSTASGDDIVETGLVSGIIFEPGLLVGNDGIWSNGSPATVAINVSSTELQSILSDIAHGFTDIEPVYTYSAWISGSKRDPSLGLYTTDYLSREGRTIGVSIRLSGVKGDYNRSKWLVVSKSELDSSFWGRLERALPEDKKFINLVKGLRTFWINNA